MDLEKLIGGREIDLLGQHALQYPNLARLNEDFSLCIVETMPENPECKGFMLLSPGHQQLDQTALTPSFVSLAALEQHTDTNMADLLAGYLFENFATQTDFARHETLATPA